MSFHGFEIELKISESKIVYAAFRSTKKTNKGHQVKFQTLL